MTVAMVAYEHLPASLPTSLLPSPQVPCHKSRKCSGKPSAGNPFLPDLIGFDELFFLDAHVHPDDPKGNTTLVLAFLCSRVGACPKWGGMHF
jgi:hypothetical protein